MPIALLKDPSVAAESKVLAGLLLAYDGPKGCFPKISSLMLDLGVSKHTVIRSLEELERYGFLKREKRGRNNVYHLTPAYVQPVRPDDVTLTGELAVENVRPSKPVKRTTLHNRRPEPTLPLGVQQVAPEQPIPIHSGHRHPERVASVQPVAPDAPAGTGSTGATDSVVLRDALIAPEQPGSVAPMQPVGANRLHRSNLDITENQDVIYNQQQQEVAAAKRTTTQGDAELALRNAGVAPEDAAVWAADLIGLSIDDITDALRIMRSKPAYRRQEINRPGAYMRTLVNTQVHIDRQLAQHEARKARPVVSPAVSSIAAPPAATPAMQIPEQVVPRRILEADALPEPAPLPVEAQLDALDGTVAARVRERALQLCKRGSVSPAWRAALAIALRDVVRVADPP